MLVLGHGAHADHGADVTGARAARHPPPRAHAEGTRTLPCAVRVPAWPKCGSRSWRTSPSEFVGSAVLVASARSGPQTRSRSHAMSSTCSAAPPGVSSTTGAPASRTTAASRSGSTRPWPRLACRSAPESKSSRLSLQCTRSMRPVMARTSVDDGLQRVAAGVRVAGVEAEADHVGTLGGGDRVPHALDPLEVAGHRVVAAGGVLDEERELEVGGLDGLAPVVEALSIARVVVALSTWPPCTIRPLAPIAAAASTCCWSSLRDRDADPVVGRGDVDDVGRVDVEVDARRLGVGPEPVGPAGVADLGALVALRVAEEELHVRRLAGRRLGDRVGLLDVGADPEPSFSHALHPRTRPPTAGGEAVGHERAAGRRVARHGHAEGAQVGERRRGGGGTPLGVGLGERVHQRAERTARRAGRRRATPVSSSAATRPAAYRSWRGSGGAPARRSGAR